MRLAFSSLPGGHTASGWSEARRPRTILSSKRLEVIIRELEDSVVDLVLIDTPAFMPVSDAAALAARVDGVFLVVNMESITRSMLAEAREFLDPLPCRKLGVIVVSEKVERGDYHRYRYYKEGEKAKV